MKTPRDYQIILVPKDGGSTRTWELGAKRIGLLKASLVVLAGAGVVALVMGLILVFQASQVPGLRAELETLRAEQQQVEALALQLQTLEEQYGSIRRMFGVDSIRDPSDLWLPPSTQPSRTAPNDPTAARPTSWPLSDRGFITQALLAGAGAEHPGLDIAVPSNSYIRASGAGIVVDVGEDPVYGRFVTLDHGEGYTTLYGHASTTMVTAGQRVRRNEVIAMSGNTGRSTAPHLHFEIRLDGEPVDPLQFVSQPG